LLLSKKSDLNAFTRIKDLLVYWVRKKISVTLVLFIVLARGPVV
jgi:hypothetical protein